ncbi:heavy metal translocating P-type ATPase [Aminipila luticellarii]|uniref:Cd(2+)-exporting ATPase n=1 Tax=Aminipila luticellarii TaxID=2507160 RepID=A0A410PYA1_9FIRM|nr:cation-translocating P-type ATPase [Aminipila luticellarii]QAT43918.1 cation-translocating P-type ATPase [Aminipila luticellarii]
MKSWIIEEDKRNLIWVILSGAALLGSLFHWQEGALPFDPAWAAIVLCGIPILVGAIKGLVVDHDIKADVLVSIALVASVFIGEYFAAGEVAFIMAIGTLLENGTSKRANQSIENLMKLTPRTARVIRKGREEIIPAEQVKVDDILVVLAGEAIAADGVILSGQTSIDQSVMTGESLPVDKTAGDPVTSGTVNQYGTFTMRATQVGEDSSLQRMIKLVKEAGANKAPIISLADRWATWMVWAALGAAVITGLVTGEWIRAVTVLVVFCPCAFILATPTAIMAGIGNAAAYGIIIRSGDALERFAKVKHMAFDKTGTLTYGKLKVIALKSFNDSLSEEKVLYYAATAEQRSEHPIGKSICAHYRALREQDLIKKSEKKVMLEPQDFILLAGQGVRAQIDGQEILIGKPDLFQQEQIFISKEIEDISEDYLKKGATVVYIGINRHMAGLIALSDTVREDAERMISKLKSLHIEPLLLTGDNSDAAQDISEKVAISKVKANLLPEDKMKELKRYTDENKPVCMVGDGINDALALKSAYAGVAMGGIGSSIAVEAADAVLVGDDIQRIPYLIRLSQKTMRKIKVNIVFSMCLNLLAVILSAMGILNPVLGALVHNAGSVAVVINSALLLTSKDE